MEGVVEAISCIEAHMTSTSAFCYTRESAYMQKGLADGGVAEASLPIGSPVPSACIEGDAGELGMRWKHARKLFTR